MPEVTTSGVTVNAEQLRDALDKLPEDGDIEDDTVRSDSVVIIGDGYEDRDVYVVDVLGNETSRRTNPTRLRTAVEDTLGPDFDGPFLRGESNDGYGFQIPLDEVSDNLDLELDADDFDSNPHHAAWNTDVDVSDLSKDGAGRASSDDPELDGYAVIEDIEIVDE